MKVKIERITHSETWNLRHKVMWPNESLDYIKLSKDETGIHFGLFKNERLISVVSLFIDKKEAQFRKLATEITEQGNGYGTMLLSYLMEYASQQKIERVWCNARANKTTFYQKFKMVPTYKKYIKGGIEFVVMEKVIA